MADKNSLKIMGIDDFKSHQVVLGVGGCPEITIAKTSFDYHYKYLT